MKLILRTLRQGRIVEQPLKKGKTVLQAEAGVEYQVVDENGQILQPEQQGSDLLWQDGDKARQTVLLLENGNAYHGELLPVSGSPAAAPALTASEAGIGKAVLLGLGAAGAVGGIAALASRGGDDSDGQEQSAQNPAPTTPVVPNNPVTSTTPVVPNNPTTPTQPVVPNTPTTPTTPVVPNNPTMPTTPVVPTNPTAPTTPVVPNNPTTPTTPVVPTNPTTPTTPVIPPKPNPVITLDPVTDDNTINLNEARSSITVSGSVAHAQNGDTITLHIGDARYAATVQNGRFSVDVDGATLANHQNIRATHQDGGEQTHGYRLALDAPRPQLFLNPVAGDNVIDKNEAAQARIEVGGRAEGVADGSKVLVVCGCPLCAGVSREATVENGAFRVSFDSSDLIADGHHMITASVQVTDAAGNTGEAQVRQDYKLTADLSPAKIAWDNIAADNIINKTESQGKIALSGSVSGLKDGETATLAIKVGSETVHTATAQNGRFSTEVDGSTLKDSDRATAVLTIANRQGEITAERGYRYDTDIKAPQISINPINGGKTLNHQNSLEQITVSGSLQYENDINPAATKLTLSINGKELSEAVSVSGSRWETKIQGSLLTKNQNENSLTVHAQIQDTAGNTAEQSQSVSYKVDTVAPTATITLDKIATDNILDHQEAQTDITVSGKVTGEFKTGDTVTLTANGKNYETSVNHDGAFTQSIKGSDLAASGSREVKAQMALTDEAGNRNTVQSEPVVYTVQDVPPPPPPVPVPTPPTAPAAEIRLNDLDSAALSRDGFTRLSGKVNLEGDFAQGKNPHRLYGIRLHINGKTYAAAIDRDSQRFDVDIPDADLKIVNGQEIAYQFDTAKQIYKLELLKYGIGSRYRVSSVDAPVLEARQVQWDDNTPLASGRLNIAPKPALTLTGTVSGAAKAGDTVLLKVGDTTVSTQVDEHKQFSAEVSRDKLAETGAVKAELHQNGKAVAHTDAAVSRETALNAEFVTAHKHVDSPTAYLERPYFLNAIMGWNYSLSHLRSAPQNPAKTATLKFAIPDAEDVGNPDSYFKNFSAEDKEAIREHLQVFSKYANVKFQEVPDGEYRDIAYYAGKLSAGINGYAEYGGNVTINTARRNSHANMKHPVNFDTLLHETMHSFGAKHPHEGDWYKERLAMQEDRRTATVMSYVRDVPAKHDIRLYDMVFLHYRFGVNPEARADNDVYRFKPYNEGFSDGNVYIWDGGGTDTFDASDQKQAVNVNLTPGSWIYAGDKSERFAIDSMQRWDSAPYFGLPENTGIDGFTDSFTYTFSKNQAFIGYGTQIERLIGSDFGDTLTGNNADNAIYGGKGDDKVRGGGGNDYLDGGQDADTLAGEAGNDTYVVDNENDRVTETADAGNDTVHSYINYTLPENVENLQLFGSALNGTGNDLSNDIKGNAQDNILSGGAGADTLTGGAGKDTFVFSDLLATDSITDFTVGEDKIGLSRSVFANVAEGQVLKSVQYDADNGHLSYQGQHFATLDTGLKLDENSFTVLA